MSFLLKPPVWLIVFIIGLPILSETVYTPALPEISKDLSTSASFVEYTLTIYLVGFAFGTLIWGKISDKFGRKYCIIAGLGVFIFGCAGCYFSASIESLMINRFVQALGGSIGSVLGQAICRDAFQGARLGKIYSITGSALALFPALGPLCGGVIAEALGWRHIFIFLGFCAFVLIAFIVWRLPETHPHTFRKKISFWNTAKRLAHDKDVIGYGLIVAACNGILFSYYAEGPFYLINLLNLSPSQYGLTFILIAVSTMGGGFLSSKLQNYYSGYLIMVYGLYIIVGAMTSFSFLAFIQFQLCLFPIPLMITVTILCQMIGTFGICMTTSNALSLALVDYKEAIGTASSLFGFFYYFFISMFTFFMGMLHDGTLIPMPFYFLFLSCFMIVVKQLLLKKGY